MQTAIETRALSGIHTATDTSVIICAYTQERWDDLVAACDSVRAQVPAPREIVVVVDHNPGMFRRVKAELPDVIAVENSDARGLSGARNSGIAAAGGTILAFLDDDAHADEGWLRRLSEAFADPRVVAAGGRIDPDWIDERPSWFPAEFGWVVGCTYRGMPERVQPVRNLIGCNMAFRREAFEAVGGFSNGIGRVGTRPVGCEETELCIRIGQRRPDSTLLYIPSASVKHRVPGKRGTWSYFLSRCYAEGLSKALVSRLVGAQDGLSSERTYTMRTLPRGVLRGLSDTVRGDPAGLGRASAIVIGLVWTTAGYLVGRLKTRRAAPVRVEAAS